MGYLLSVFVNCLICFGSRKYEEIKPPEVEDFCYITDNTYSKEEVIFWSYGFLVFLCICLCFFFFLVLDLAKFGWFVFV